MKFLFVALVFLVNILSLDAQIIDFPDAKFKNALVNSNCVDTSGNGLGDRNADFNNDGEIDLEEAQRVFRIIIKTKFISNITGIEYFSNLTHLNLEKNKLITLDISSLLNLESLVLNENDIISIDVSSLTKLKHLELGRNKLTSIDVSSLTNLENLVLRENHLVSLDVSTLTNLKNLVAYNNRLTSVNVEGLINLDSLDLDSNRLTSFNFYGLSNLKYLSLGINQFTSINFDGLNNLEYLNLTGNRLSSLNVDELMNLKQLYCGSNLLWQLTVTGLDSLNLINCSGNQMSFLNLFELNNLTSLNCFNNKLTEINIDGLSNIKSLICSNNGFTSLNLGEFSKLENLELNFNELSSLNIVGLSNLTTLSCNYNKLPTLNLEGLSNLTTLSCNYNKLSSLNLEGLTNLSTIYCVNNQLISLDVTGLNNLTTLSCGNNQLTSLDVTGLNNLNKLYCTYNNLNSLFIKTGKKMFSLSFGNNKNLVYICCNDNEITSIKNKAHSYGLNNSEVNSYCSFTPGGKSYNIIGNATFDGNNNGCDDQDKISPNLKYNITDGNISATFFSNFTGNYNFPVSEGTHTLIPILEHPDHFEITPPVFTFTFPNSTDTIAQNFCITPKEPFREVDITVLPLSPPARPGFDAKYKIIWENKGNLLENGILHFTYDEAIFDYVNASINPGIVANGNLQWNYTDLLPFERREVTVTLNLNSPAETPAVNSGDITYLYAHILDNIFTLENTIVGSYDPNDKTCLQGNYFHPDSVGKFVDFLIRFENTGNYPAENVVIKDIIDDKVFDVSSLQITDASHEVYTRIAANKVEFIFENIQLPFEDEINDGYVAFKIKTKSTLKLGNELKNLADIYFDYNFPIRTNETFTTVAIPSGTSEIYKDIKVYPNPVHDILILEGNTNWLKAEIYDISGRIIRVTGVENLQIDVSGMDGGTYILKLRNREKTGVVKFVKL